MATKTMTKSTREEISEKAREIWLAGLGLFATMEEEGEKLLNQFIDKGRGLEERGETFEKKARNQLDSVASFITEQGGKIKDEVSQRFSDLVPGFVEEKFNNALDMFGISTRKEVNKLSEKVNKLTETVSTLAQKLGETGKPPTAMPKV